jgi:hypothetical protein
MASEYGFNVVPTGFGLRAVGMALRTYCDKVGMNTRWDFMASGAKDRSDSCAVTEATKATTSKEYNMVILKM